MYVLAAEALTGGLVRARTLLVPEAGRGWVRDFDEFIQYGVVSQAKEKVKEQLKDVRAAVESVGEITALS